MLTKDQVSNAVCEYIISKGYFNLSGRLQSRHGIDVEAVSPGGVKICIDILGSNREDLTEKQVFRKITKAVYTAMTVVEEGQDTRAAIAMPLEPSYQKYAIYVKTSLRKLNISIYWVYKDLLVIEQ